MQESKLSYLSPLFVMLVLLYRAVELLELSHIRLDREQISEIDNLDCLGPVTNLYLQKVSSLTNNKVGICKL